MDQTDLIAPHCRIAQAVHASVTMEAYRNSALKDIAERHGSISPSSVQRFLIQDHPTLTQRHCCLHV